MNSLRQLEIVILGGGTAGWMTACLFAHHWRDKPVRITVVESPEIGIIGVGEGSTPQMKAFFDLLQIDEAEWMPACDATYKIGIRFNGWSKRPGFESYFHPFPSSIDVHTQRDFFHNCRLRRAGYDVPAHPDLFYLPPLLADLRKGPHPTENFPFRLAYGYHFDAYKVGTFLAKHATNLGVVHLERRVADADIGEDGNITALVTEDGQRISGDFFVDCSGFRSILAQEKLGARFLPFGENLFNDSAVVMPTELPEDGSLSIATGSHAMSAGWRWEIPLTTRFGNGYVYSSRYIDAEAAESELRSVLGPACADSAARHLKMKVGRLEDSWSANCLAMGLAQGFVEPLEATALHVVIATALEFCAAFEAGGFTPSHRETFNSRIAHRYEGIRDYIVAHYRMNRRDDTDYWRDSAGHDRLSDNLKAMMTAWFTGRDIEDEINRLGIGDSYSAISWHCLFAGYGTFPNDAKLRTLDGGLRSANMQQVSDFIRRAGMNFTDHRDTLTQLAHGAQPQEELHTWH